MHLGMVLHHERVSQVLLRFVAACAAFASEATSLRDDHHGGARGVLGRGRPVRMLLDFLDSLWRHLVLLRAACGFDPRLLDFEVTVWQWLAMLVLQVVVMR